MNGMDFDFSVDFMGEIEDISSNGDHTNEECTEVLQKLLNGEKIVQGERTEGNVSIDNDVITLDYRWCSEVGEDWNDDVWNDEYEQIPLTEIQ